MHDRRLYLITPARDALESFLEAALSGGVDVVQIREKELHDAELLPRLRIAREVTRVARVPLVVNDRVDLAVLAEADYVHVGQDDLPVDAARSFGIDVGLSTHSEAQIASAHDTGMSPDVTAPAQPDYLGVGPVYETPTKAGRRPVGLELVRHAARHATLPWFAIGGIDEHNASEVIAAGARRLAVVRAICDADDPERAAASLSRIVRAQLP